MRKGVGVDTGGTYTDAVIYDFDTKTILASAKALTTKEDLAVGIDQALAGLPPADLQAVELVSLSTTLATNACVEEKGGRGKLIFIGADIDIVKRTGAKYGLPPTDEIYFLAGEINLQGEVAAEPAWDDFLTKSREWLQDADAVAVVQQLGNRNSVLERKAKAALVEKYGLKVICGYELFADLNYIKRGSSTLLNARLIPVIDDFLQAVKLCLKKRKIKAPVVIVRSDGSVMSEKFTTVRPVETLLCGPAASVMGGVELTGAKNSIIVDMGGTTTDLALVKDGVPVKAAEGVSVGNWQTFVKAVQIDTFGLGGDSSIRLDRQCSLTIGPSRVVPLSQAAERWPVVKEKLAALVNSGIRTINPVYEFFHLVKDISGSNNFTAEEKRICTALREGPLAFAEIGKVVGRRVFIPYLERLEQEGIIMRCGLTPTDFMHLKGDFQRFDTKAALLGATYLAYCLGLTVEQLTEQVYDQVSRTLYLNIIRLLLTDKSLQDKKNGLTAEVAALINNSWEIAKGKSCKDFLRPDFQITATLVGVGAPTHVFLPYVAQALGASYIIPENAGVANALGAIVGQISATSEIQVKTQYAVGGSTGYVVFGTEKNSYVLHREEALEIAAAEAKAAAVAEACRRGASGDITVTVDIGNSQESAILLATKVCATAIGRALL